MSATAVSCEWLSGALATFAAAHASGRTPHAVLIHAPPGVGGSLLADALAQIVLCTGSGNAKPNDTARAPCGVCTGCRRVTQHQHPDLIEARPSEDSQQIRIEQIRELAAELALTSHQGGYKVGIIDPADTLNRFAANALLKTLEEPPLRTLLILVAAQPSRLPATLVSRCQRISVHAPTRAQSLAWLTQLRGPGEWAAVLDVIGEAPLAAAQLDSAAVSRLRAEVAQTLAAVRAGRVDPANTAERWSRNELPLRLTLLENWITDLIRAGLVEPRRNVEVRSGAQSGGGAPVMNTRNLFHVLDRVRELRAALTTPINRALALESLLRSL